MAWIYLAESEGSQSLWSRGSGRSPIVSLTSTRARHSWIVWKKGRSASLRSGTTSEPLKQNIFPRSTSSSEGSHVRTSVLLELERAWKESDLPCFSRSSDSLANFDPDSFSWKTSQLSLFGGLTEFSWSSLRWGTIVDGRLFQPRKLEPHTCAKDGSYWPTPLASDGAKGGPNQRGSKGNLALPAAVMKFPTPCARDYRAGDRPDSVRAQTRDYSPNLNDVAAPGGQLNPTWVEWLMGFPLGWTELRGSGMQLYRFRRGRRSRYLAD